MTNPTPHRATPEWRDCTTYRQGDKERIPHSFEVCSGDLRLSITNNHIYHKGTWVMHCHAIGIDTQPLDAATKDQACREAWKCAEARLDSLKQDLEAIPFEALP